MADVISILTSPFFDLIDIALEAPLALVGVVSVAAILALVLAI